MTSIHNPISTPESDTGDPEVARKLIALSKALPNYPGDTIANDAFARRSVQEFILHKILTGGRRPSAHPLWPAFDPSVDSRHLHMDEVDLDSCEACQEEMFGTLEEFEAEHAQLLAHPDSSPKS